MKKFLLSSFILPFSLCSTALAEEAVRDPFEVLKAEQTPAGCLSHADIDYKSLGLLDLIELGICRNPTLAVSYMQAKSSAATYGKALSAYLPSLSAGANLTDSTSKNTKGADDGWNNSGNYGASLSLSYLVYDFGGREADRQVAQANLEQANFSKNQSLQDTVFSVISAYYSLLSAKEALTVAKTNAETYQKSFDIANRKYELGLVKLSDKLQAETSYSQSLYSITSAEATLADSKGKLAELLNLPAYTDLDLAEVALAYNDGLIAGEPEELIEKALASRPDLKAQEAATASSAAALDKAKTADYPTISLGGSASAKDTFAGGSGQTYSGSIGLTLSVPIFTGFSNTYNTLSKTYAYEGAKAKLAATQSSIRSDVWTKYQAYTKAVKNYEIAGKVFTSATESYRVASGAYKAGKGNILELLNAQSSLAEARKGKSSSLYDLLLAKNDLLRAIGQIEV